MEEVVITVQPDGSASVRVNCVAGTSCKAVSAAIEKALGSTTSDIPTEDMRKKEVTRAEHSR